MASFLTWNRREVYNIEKKIVILSYVFFCDFAYIKQRAIVVNAVKKVSAYYVFFKFLFNGVCHMHPINFFFFDVSLFNFFLPGSFFFKRKEGVSSFDVRSSFLFFLGNVFLFKVFLHYAYFFFFFSENKRIFIDFFFFIFLTFFLSFFFLINGNVQSNFKVSKAKAT